MKTHGIFGEPKTKLTHIKKDGDLKTKDGICFETYWTICDNNYVYIYILNILNILNILYIYIYVCICMYT